MREILMLREIPTVRQVKGDPHRRWFTDQHLNLIIWHEEAHIVGFQFCYDKSRDEHAITWKIESGFKRNGVDSGENRAGRYKGAPILVADGSFDAEKVSSVFRTESGELHARSTDFIYQKLLECPRS